MSESPTSTIFDFTESDIPSSSPSPSVTLAARSRYYIPGDLAIFKVEDRLFRIDRSLLDNESALIPRGNSQDPIDLRNLKADDFETLLDYLTLGYANPCADGAVTHRNYSTRNDKQPLTLVDWASIITVCSRYGMERVLDDACKAILCQHNATINIRSAGAGFENDSHGVYFQIREKGTAHYLSTCCSLNTEGIQLQLWGRESGSVDVKRSMARHSYSEI
ncbi:hypothetical protein HWV62_18870 [Athelia sp. TMB]|nr:hypothetical protein HWV62_18870 [Athelia sp. TMB]